MALFLLVTLEVPRVLRVRRRHTTQSEGSPHGEEGGHRDHKIQAFSRILDQGQAMKSIETGELDIAASMLQDWLLKATIAVPAMRRNKPWFDRECHEMRNKVLERLNDQKNQPGQEKRGKYN